MRFATLIFNLIKVEQMLLSDGRKITAVQHFRVINISQKCKTVKFLHKDKINPKMFGTTIDKHSAGLIISILRRVICLVRRSRRTKSSMKNKIFIFI
jgi:hypothetical protein